MEFLLFSGHMIDNAGTKTTRFPLQKKNPSEKSLLIFLSKSKTTTLVSKQ